MRFGDLAGNMELLCEALLPNEVEILFADSYLRKKCCNTQQQHWKTKYSRYYASQKNYIKESDHLITRRCIWFDNVWVSEEGWWRKIGFSGFSSLVFEMNIFLYKDLNFFG